MNATLPVRAATPWYREPWPWLLMLGPATVIVAGFVTLFLAFESNDGLVADDYYKLGLAINKTMQREDRARALGLSAAVAYSAESGRVRVILAGNTAPPAQLTLRLAHPTRAGMDQRVTLTDARNGVYEASAALPPGVVRWNAVLETSEWRLAGSWANPAHAALSLGTPRS
jgi:hypothetical protein